MDAQIRMFFCNLCQKPFTHEASRNRHVSYCRRSRDRPRVRHQSCQACSAAKARCSFQPQCSRCRHKGLECVYDHPNGRQNATLTPAALKSKAVPPPTPVDTSTPTPLPRSEIIANNMELVGDELSWDINLDLLQINQSTSTAAPVCDTISAPTTATTSTYVSEDPQVSDAQAMASLEELYTTGETPVTGKTDFLSTITIPPALTTLETSGFLTPLPMSSPAAQCNANYIIQMLRPFPQLMVQKATFPPFIHPSYYKRCTDSHSPVLQAPLANCMSIAQMFVPRTQETKPFVWKTIRMEQRRLLSEMETFDREELLAAIQVYIIYLIMRIVDDTLRHSEHDLHMLLSFQLLCEQFRKICAQPFALDEQANPNHTWQDWIFSESRRRVACLWFIISRVICVKTGIPCDTTEVYRAIPLPSGHSLWTANCHEVWEAEYRASQMNYRRPRLAYFGELIEAQRNPGDGSNSQKLDLWHTDADQLGIMLMLATAMV
ncbi:Zn(II)2Cys6 transcription factor domain-containing protein [Aspergillus melleus]|uniref:Zn(II)2Cys6 transcription factor domain-containing protein n=1 Tax=Aspergillus melleus TaxID=138277 RepID=UPI001E8E2DBF|nr:uncharacterized protein LDX57_006911 [Aspergillus melleus]KAH8429244.1 hypothetical protein LDX57_006911 [Aspergillus melleus]